MCRTPGRGLGGHRVGTELSCEGGAGMCQAGKVRSGVQAETPQKGREFREPWVKSSTLGQQASGLP